MRSPSGRRLPSSLRGKVGWRADVLLPYLGTLLWEHIVPGAAATTSSPRERQSRMWEPGVPTGLGPGFILCEKHKPTLSRWLSGGILLPVAKSILLELVFPHLTNLYRKVLMILMMIFSFSKLYWMLMNQDFNENSQTKYSRVYWAHFGSMTRYPMHTSVYFQTQHRSVSPLQVYCQVKNKIL